MEKVQIKCALVEIWEVKAMRVKARSFRSSQQQPPSSSSAAAASSAAASSAAAAAAAARRAARMAVPRDICVHRAAPHAPSPEQTRNTSRDGLKTRHHDARDG